jgi:chemotaxis protein methyltransferase CheR
MVVPWLFELTVPKVRIWSAGCAGGEEPYSLAIALREHAEPRGVDLNRFEILATDVDRSALAVAARAEYGSFSLTETSQPVRDRWFDAVSATAWRVRPEVRAMVRFDTIDLINDPLPSDVHLIFCRNVIIYFERAVQERLFRRFNAALAPGGFLVLGKVETLFGAAAAGYRSIANRERIFRKA